MPAPSPTRTPPRRPAEGKPVGRHGAADPARDPVGVCGLDVHRADAVRRLSSATRSSCCRAARGARRAAGGVARRRRVHRCTALTEPAVLARDRRHRRRPGTATSSIRRCRRGSEAAGRPSTRCSTTSTTSTASTTGSSPAASRALGTFLSNVGDRSIIDGFFVNGTARVVGWPSALLRHMQSGYVYHYAFTMIVGLFALLSWWTLR